MRTIVLTAAVIFSLLSFVKIFTIDLDKAVSIVRDKGARYDELVNVVQCLGKCLFIETIWLLVLLALQLRLI